MNFDDAEEEIRARLAESSLFLRHLRAMHASELSPSDDLQKSLKAHWLVSLYASLERGINAVIEAALFEITSAAPASDACLPPLHSLIHFPMIQALRDCSNNRIFDRSVALFDASQSGAAVKFSDNPLAERLQNVDGKTFGWLLGLFGAEQYEIEASHLGRLNNLRERRNAVAHGRESAVEVGQRFGLDELARLYEIVDEELTRFQLSLSDHCSAGSYMRRVA